LSLKARFYLFSPEDLSKTQIPILNELMQLPFEALHLKSSFASETIQNEYLSNIKAHNKLVIHQLPASQLKFPNVKIHLNALTAPFSGSFQSTSAHTLKELEEKQYLNSKYIFLSPIYDSISKKEYESRWTKSHIMEALTISKIPLVALGGIRLDSIETLMNLGIDRFGLLGSVWNEENLIKSAETFFNRFA
jgi:thiamine-phosphate pyrophosphorylase